MMPNLRGLIATISIIFLFLLSGCASPYTGRIDTSLYNTEAASQPYEPAIVVLGGIHRDRDVGVFKLNFDRSLAVSFAPLSKVVQVVNGESIERKYLRANVSESGTVLSVPPGHYRVFMITTGSGRVSSQHSVGKSKPGEKDYGFSVKSGEVINLGFIESYFSRKDKTWLDLKIEAREEVARLALRNRLNDAESYIEKLETRVLNLPNKIF